MRFYEWLKRKQVCNFSRAYRGVRKEGNQSNISKEEDDAQWYNVGSDQVLDCYFFYTLLVEIHETCSAGSGGSGDLFVFVVSEENIHP